MNIAVIKESLCIGGTERSASAISQALAQTHQVFTILFDESDIQYPYGGQLIGLSLPPRSNNIIGKVYNSFLRSYRVKKEIEENKIDIVFVLTSVSGYMMHDKLRKCKKIVSCRDFGKLERNTGMYAHALHNANAIVFNSEYQKKFYVSQYPKDAEKCFVSYNIIDCDMILQSAKETVDSAFTDFLYNHTTTVVSVGRFCREKGFEYLIDSFYLAHKQNPELGLVLIGDGSFRQLYEEKIHVYGLDNHVYFTGFQNNPYKYMARCNIFVLSSVSEGFPNVVPEAMACGLPVICTNCLTGPAEILNKTADYALAQDSYKICDYGILTPAFKGNQNTDNAIRNMAEVIQKLAEDQKLFKYLQGCSAQRVKDFSASSALQELQDVIDFVMET